MMFGDFEMGKINRNILINICLDEIDIAKDKLKSIETESDKRILYEGWIRKQKQILKENGYRKQKNGKSKISKI